MIPEELRRVKPMSGKERLGAHRDSEYLGAEDIEPGTEPVLTIDALYYAKITLQRGKEEKDVITFKEESVPGINKVRPLVVNSTNRKTLKKIYKRVDAETLANKKIQLWVDHNVRDPQTGELTDGIRIRPRIPTAAKAEPIICESCGKQITAIQKYSAEQIAQLNMKRYGKKLCGECSKKLAEEAQAGADQECEEDDDTAATVSAEELEGQEELET